MEKRPLGTKTTLDLFRFDKQHHLLTLNITPIISFPNFPTIYLTLSRSVIIIRAEFLFLFSFFFSRLFVSTNDDRTTRKSFVIYVPLASMSSVIRYHDILLLLYFDKRCYQVAFRYVTRKENQEGGESRWKRSVSVLVMGRLQKEHGKNDGSAKYILSQSFTGVIAS